ncbi:MAG: hypothetical protein ACT4RN_14600 [Pseudonocardia sp.]
MPSPLHEVLVEMFRTRPSLAAELLDGPLGVRLPAFESARVDSSTFTELPATEYRADAVVMLAAGDAPAFAVIVEVQLGRDPDKKWSWPAYLTNLRARLHCPVAVLVLCLDTAIAAWCAGPIDLGPGSVITPLVLGPRQVPLITDPARAAETPELAVLSAIAHGGGPSGDDVLDAVLGAFAAVDPDRAALYCDVVLAALPAAARSYLEALVTATYEYQSEFARRYFSEGKAAGHAAGEARAVLAVLDARGVDVPADARARISACTDVDQLDAWVRRAVTAASVQDLFA